MGEMVTQKSLELSHALASEHDEKFDPKAQVADARGTDRLETQTPVAQTPVAQTLQTQSE